MRIHTLQHVPFEGLGSISTWLEHSAHHLSSTHFYQDCHLPQPDEFDALIIMGGPMGIYDDQQYPWLKQERKFIKQTINDKKPVLGVCLGAQFIADALGSKAYPNTHKEIGWFDIEKTKKASNSAFGKHLPERFTALHWHGDTFDLPEGATPLLSSEACQNQAFSVADRVLALQFHLEMTPSSTHNIIQFCANDLVSDRYIQDAATIANTNEHYDASNVLMNKLLNQLLHHNNF
ncbi:MAG: type 1 glutamine amidotransferase [Gammaproteobacteria bacterium]|nr:type 1 glutamine amidotransferase [Gammaproteobacteria bacterium]